MQIKMKIKQILAPPTFANKDKTRAAELLNTTLLSFLVLPALIPVFASLVTLEFDPFTWAFCAVGWVIFFGLWRLMHRGAVELAATLSLFSLLLLITAANYVFDGIRSSDTLAYFLIIILAGLLSKKRTLIVSVTLSSISMVTLIYVAEAQAWVVYEERANLNIYFAITIILLALGGVLLRYATRQLNTALDRAQRNERALNTSNQTLEERTRNLERLSSQLQTAAQVTREVAVIRDVDQLLDQTVRLISERFDFYHAGIFLLDEADEYAVLRAASSQGGQRMRAREHKLKVSEGGIVGYVTTSGEPRVALDVREPTRLSSSQAQSNDVGEDAAFFDNPDGSTLREHPEPVEGELAQVLPGTRSELALPLKVRGHVIGALDVQSTAPEAFGEDDVAVLQVMADQLAIAIENAQLLQATQQTVQELGSAVSEILAVTSQQAAGANEQSAALSQTSTTVDEVKIIAEQSVSRAQEVADASQRTVQVSRDGRRAVENTIASMGRIKERVEGIAENILALSEQTQQIGDIIASVNDLAAQSNMLALNAAVEAARAGEHGKGFAVVAAEVRALAEQSKQATAQVKAILHDIQGATNSTVMATEEGTKGVDEGVSLAAQAQDAIAQLAGVIDASARAAAQMVAGGRQQASGVEQIALAMGNIHQATNQSLASTQQAEQTAQDLSELARSLSEIVEQYQM